MSGVSNGGIGLHSAREIALAFGVSERTVRRAIKSGRLNATKRGASFQISLEEARPLFEREPTLLEQLRRVTEERDRYRRVLYMDET